MDKEKVGSGAFGIVMKCKWRGTPVAIKQIHKHMAEDEIARVEFALELKVNASVAPSKHCSIFRRHDFGETNQVSIVSEFMQGGSLDQLFRSGKILSLCEAANMSLDCARGMAYLHGRVRCGDSSRLETRKFDVDEDWTFENWRFWFIENFVSAKQDPNPTVSQEPFVLTGETGSYRYMAPEVFPPRIL